ncbi:hypothetical protein [Sporichthya polymorpha]|uniref:hypothetical protein n=1 Tax=Sporichthya polymorpha TaxID=35751 RepID=UPI00035DECDF|nr:hypothetical protein [Sporichthya polymorpha]
MNVGVKLTAFAAVTAAFFGLAFGVGSLLDPIAPEDEVGLAMADESDGAAHGGMNMSGETAEQSPSSPSSAAPAGAKGGAVGAADLPGLAVSSRGYTLRVVDVTPRGGDSVEVGFTITSPDGGTVLNFDTTHEKQMHLIVVRRDMANFQHLHPERDAEGMWRVPVDLRDAGVYRFFADFSPSALGETITLGSDAFVPGDYTPAELPEPSTEWSSDDFQVTLAGTPAAGEEAELTFTVTRNGGGVTDLEPYLGAFGHLVSLRSGDLAYLHTHPAEEASGDQLGGPEIRFGTTFPTAGLYRLYLNFAHDGEVRTAEFTVEVLEGSGTPAVSPDEGDSASTEPSPPPSDVHSGH